MSAAYWTFRRELHGMLRAPIVYLVGGLFLAVQGIAFAGLVGAMSDPRRPALLSSLLEGQLAGTLLTWVLQLVVITLLGMRAIADDKTSGAWELALTAGASERAVVVGKWLAATVLYALLWIPTLAYFAVVAAFREGGQGFDLLQIAVGYGGAIALGAALLAWAIAASAATSQTLTAGALGFALLVAIFLAGELPVLWPELGSDVLAAISIRAQLAAIARGEVSLGALVAFAGIAVTGLSAAIAFACVGRRRKREVRARFGATVAFAGIAVALVAICARHPVAWDATRDERNTLDPATREVLAELPQASLVIVEPLLAGADAIYVEVERVLRMMGEANERIAITRVDPAHAPGGLEAIAREAGLQPQDLAAGGAVIVQVGARRRVVELLALATLVRPTTDAPPAVERLAIEQAIGGALAELARTTPITACPTTGHGELPLEAAGGDQDWATVAARLRGEGIALGELATGACDVILVAGPTQPLSPDEALALQRHVEAGRGLLVAAASRPGPGGALSATGVEAVLAADGIGLPLAIAIDPSLVVRELPGALLVVDGYRDHAINLGFANARATLWFQPRAVVTDHPLIAASPQSWGERDFTRAPAKDPDDLAGPIALAAVGAKHRLVVVGSAESFSTAVLAGGAGAGDLWLARAVRWLAHEPATSIAARTPAQVRLVMTDGERRLVTVICVGVIPLAWAALGGAIVVLRRRRRGAS